MHTAKNEKCKVYTSASLLQGGRATERMCEWKVMGYSTLAPPHSCPLGGEAEQRRGCLKRKHRQVALDPSWARGECRNA
eukprot:1159129-Pelagomonas_calceolata.AAC.4